MIQTIRYGDGNCLAYADYGDPNGFPILVQHGLIASIEDGDLFEQLTSSGGRVICMARPGYGQSSPHLMRNVAEWGEIASGLVEELKLAQFDILAISSGATYGYAIAYKYPQQVGNLFVLNGIPALYDEEILSLWPYPSNKDASLTEMQKLASDLFFSNLSETDLGKKEIKDSMMHQCFGIAQDFLLRAQDWGFRLQDVPVHVHMRHNRSENLQLAELTSSRLPNCTLEISDQEEHFSKEVLDNFIRTVMTEYYRK